MATETAHGAMPYLAGQTVNAYVAYDETLDQLDLFMFGHVKDVTATPPASPSEGDAYIIDSGATGAWTGQAADTVAHYVNGAWRYYTPAEGTRVWRYESGVHQKLLVYTEDAWEALVTLL